MMIQIRKAESADFEAVYRLICFLEGDTLDFKGMNQVYEENLRDRAIEYLVAVSDDDVVGFASLHIQRLLHHAAQVGEIQELIVAMEARGQGIGGKLFDALQRIATDRSCAGLEVTSSVDRKRAHDFYQRRGLRQTHIKLTRVLTPPKPIRRSFTYESHDAEG